LAFQSVKISDKLTLFSAPLFFIKKNLIRNVKKILAPTLFNRSQPLTMGNPMQIQQHLVKMNGPGINTKNILMIGQAC